MFGRHPRLAIDAFLGLKPSGESGRNQAEYTTKFQSRLAFAYQKATEEAARQTERYKAYYDQKVRESKIEVGDRVLIRALGLKGKTKIADEWEDIPYIVKEVPIEGVPVYTVKQEDGKGRDKTLHRIHLLPFSYLPSEPLLAAPATPTRNSPAGNLLVVPDPPQSDTPVDTESDSSELEDSFHSEEEQPSTQRTPAVSRRGGSGTVNNGRGRPQRNTKPPGWLATGQWAT